MAPNLLVLGGTSEATALCRALSDASVDGTVSFAGRVARPVRQPLPQRVGGFGGAEGLAGYLTANSITHVVDATHPFAAQMSRNAVNACASVGVPLLALTRPAWVPQTGDRWQSVPDIAAAVRALKIPKRRIMLAVGRMHLADFAPNPQHFYLFRLVDPPERALPFPEYDVVVDRGPFTVDGDLDLMREHDVSLVVSKNSGGTGAAAKLTAARQLDLPVLMINRPSIPRRQEAVSVSEVFDWLDHAPADLGV